MLSTAAGTHRDPRERLSNTLCLALHTLHPFHDFSQGTPLSSCPFTTNHHSSSESWQRTNPYSFKQPVIFRVFMYRYKLCVLRYHHHLQTCPLKIHFRIFRTDLGSGFHKCRTIKPLPLQIRCQVQQWSLNQKKKQN